MSKKLTPWQSDAIGTNFSNTIWSNKVSFLYKKAAADSLYGDEESISQSFGDFVEMGNRIPNEEGLLFSKQNLKLLRYSHILYVGTGRFLLQYDNRNVIYLLCTKNDVIEETLVQFISSYFGMKVVAKSLDLSFEKRGKQIAIVDIIKHVKFPLKIVKKGDSVDVFSIFDVLVEYLPVDAYAAVFLIGGIPIVDPLAPKDLIYGRACGDRVAVVSSNLEQSRRDYFLTILHELMHLFGIDHCEAFSCIMNPCAGEDSGTTMEVCPADLRKLQVAVTGRTYGLSDNEKYLTNKRKRTVARDELKIDHERNLRVDEITGNLDYKERWEKLEQL
jgi:hypothetical protein